MTLSQLFYRLYWRAGNKIIHWNRVVMDQMTRQWMETNKIDGKVLEISGKQWENYGFQSYSSLGFPEFDICEPNSINDKYDIIIAEQVFEHLLWPYRATKNVFQMLKPGGYFLITLPFLVRVHHCPVDCSRWTELGLKYFLAECGFKLENIETGSWGNRKILKAHARNGVVPFYIKGIHSLKNEPLYPSSVWAFAKKE